MYTNTRIDRNLMVVEFSEQLIHHEEVQAVRRLRIPGLYPRYQRRLIETLSRNMRMSVGQGAHAFTRVCQLVGRLSVPLQIHILPASRTSLTLEMRSATLSISSMAARRQGIFKSSIAVTNASGRACSSDSIEGTRGHERKRGGRAKPFEDALPVRFLRLDVKWI